MSGRTAAPAGYKLLAVPWDRVALWTCFSCGSGLVNGILAHHDSCTEVR